ncbi:MAG: hypothetical protein Q8N17_26280 [Burkholderiaceae bacterium]|nr:hypothetical protein [Burkholderiaceae bacterium]
MLRPLLFTLALLAAQAHATTVYQLERQWLNGIGHRFCQYSDGTILNVKFNVCPLTIKG